MKKAQIIYRKVMTLRGTDLSLEWNNIGNLLRWSFDSPPPHQYTFKNIIKFRGYLREYIRDINSSQRIPIITGLITKKVSIVTHLSALNTSVRFISMQMMCGYLAPDIVKIMLNEMGHSIVLLSEKQCKKD